MFLVWDEVGGTLFIESEYKAIKIEDETFSRRPSDLFFVKTVLVPILYGYALEDMYIADLKRSATLMSYGR